MQEKLDWIQLRTPRPTWQNKIVTHDVSYVESRFTGTRRLTTKSRISCQKMHSHLPQKAKIGEEYLRHLARHVLFLFFFLPVQCYLWLPGSVEETSPGHGRSRFFSRNFLGRTQRSPWAAWLWRRLGRRMERFWSEPALTWLPMSSLLRSLHLESPRIRSWKLRWAETFYVPSSWMGKFRPFQQQLQLLDQH